MIKQGNDNFSMTPKSKDGYSKTEDYPSGKITDGESFPTDDTAPNPNKKELENCPKPTRQDFVEINLGEPVGNRIEQISLHFVDLRSHFSFSCEFSGLNTSSRKVWAGIQGGRHPDLKHGHSLSLEMDDTCEDTKDSW